MAGNKYIELNNGRLAEKPAKDASAGAVDAGSIVALGSDGRLDPSVMPTGIGADTSTLPASEDLSGGDFVNVWNDGGVMSARKADASSVGKEADGFVLDAVSMGQPATVYFEGRNTALLGLTLGARYYLSATTPGVATTTPPAGTGKVVQYLGRAVEATAVAFEATDGVILA